MKIGVLENLGMDELLELTRELRESAPEISIKFTRIGNDELMKRLVSQRIDIAITFDYAIAQSPQVSNKAL